MTTKKGIEKPTIHCYLALTLITKFGISFTEIARGVFRPLKDVYLNDNIPSKERATLISFEATSHHIGGAGGLLVSGFLAEKLSIPVTWTFSGALLAGSGIWLWRNHIASRSQ